MNLGRASIGQELADPSGEKSRAIRRSGLASPALGNSDQSSSLDSDSNSEESKSSKDDGAKIMQANSLMNILKKKLSFKIKIE